MDYQEDLKILKMVFIFLLEIVSNLLGQQDMQVLIHT